MTLVFKGFNVGEVGQCLCGNPEVKMQVCASQFTNTGTEVIRF